jgi:hypothetical protein
MTETFRPEVKPEAEFLEICNDFTEPREIVREAISNAFDARANVIKIGVYIDRSHGIDELVLTLDDDGQGMDIEGVKAFFNLGFSTRRIHDARGFKTSGAIGEKGHGTKIYFNSRTIEVRTRKDGQLISADMQEPRRQLQRGDMPIVNFVIEPTTAENGTQITVRGYNSNLQGGFGHEALKDYILWFTKFGSCELELGKKTFQNVVLHLAGLGHVESDPDRLAFGHRFAPENTNLTILKKSDKVAPLDFYVARWVFPAIPVDGKPGSVIDIVFSLEGDQAKRHINPMLHEKWQTWAEGEYNVEERYGFWVCKDFIPIDRRNNWVAERSEWTKFHAFVNSQDFRLTANRSSIDNTPAPDLKCIQQTVTRVFKERIEPDDKYRKYLEELERQQLYKNAEAEEKDFNRRKKAAMAQRVATYEGRTLIAPRQEGGVFSLVMQLLAIDPYLFDFTVVDYDTAFGYDLLVTQDTALDLNRAALRFVEMKHELRREFSHSFSKLAAVICWDTKLANEDTVEDLTGAKRTMKITSPRGDESLEYTKYMLVSDTAGHNIEVLTQGVPQREA